MLNRNIKLTIWAISLISLLGIVNLAINPIQEARALQQFEITPPASPTMVRQMDNVGSLTSTKSYTVIAGSTSGQPFIDIYNTTTSNLIQAINVTSGVGFASGWTLLGISCSTTIQFIPSDGLCAVAYHVTGHNDRVFLVDVLHGYAQNTVTAGASYTSNQLYNVVLKTSPSNSGVGDQIYVIYHNAGVKIDAWRQALTNNQASFQGNGFIFGFTYNTGFADGVAINDFEMGIFNTTNNAGSIQTYLGFTSSTNNLFASIDIGGLSTKCQTSISGDTATLDIQYINDTGNGVNNVNGLDWIIAGSTATNKFIKIDNSCNLKTTYTVNSMILTTNGVRSLGFSQSRHEIYMYAGTTKNSIIVINATKTGANADQTFVTGTYQMSEDKTTPLYNGIVASNTSNGMIAVGETTKLYWLYWVQSGSSGQSGGSATQQQTYTDSNGNTCIDIYDTTGTIKLTTYCSTSTSNGKIQANTLRLMNTGANVSNTGFVLGCGAGFVSCTNANAQTNGVGLIILGLVILISYILIVVLHYEVKSNLMKQNVVLQEVMRVDPFILIAMVFIDTAILWQVKLVPDIVFYTLVTLIAGFTAFGIYRHVR